MMPGITQQTCQICKITEDSTRMNRYTCAKCDNGLYCHTSCLKQRKCNKCKEGTLKNWHEQNPGMLM